MKKVGNAQSGTLLVEMTDAAFNFKADITDAQAEQIYKGLLNKKSSRRTKAGLNGNAYFFVPCNRPWASR